MKYAREAMSIAGGQKKKQEREREQEALNNRRARALDVSAGGASSLTPKRREPRRDAGRVFAISPDCEANHVTRD